MSCIPHKTLSQSEIKITYLHEENKLLKERIQDLEEIIKLNKKANERTIALESHSKQEPLINKHSRSNAAEEQLKFFKSITDELTKENSSLNLKIEKLMKEVDLAKDKALMCDQVANEFKRQERETTNDYKTELLNLKKKLEEKEKKNKEMQVGGIFRIKNIISTDEKSILYHSELEGYKFIMAKTLKKISILKNEKEELIKLNQQFFNEIIKYKELLSLEIPKTNNFLNQNLQNNNIFTATNQTLHLLEFHQKFYRINIEDDNLTSLNEISPVHSPLPLKVDQINNSNNKKLQEIPKLDINKAILFQEMAINEKRKNNGSELPQRETVLHASTIAEKIKKTENELKRTKKLLQNEMLENQMLKSQMLKIDEENVSLRSKNRFLLEAQKTFEVKFKKINNLLTIYKHYNKNCPKNITGIGCTTNNHSHNRNKSENNYNFLAVLPSKNKFSVESFAFSNNNDLLSTDEVNNRDLDFLETRIREQLMTDKESKRIVNLSLIDSEECKNEDYSERAQYIKFIQNMGNYLNEIYKGGDMSGLRKKKIRSNSLIGTCNTVRQLSNLNTILAKKPGQISEQNKYLSLRFDFKETFNKISQKSNFNIPNPRLERNLISPISKPNDKERGASYVSTLRKNYNHGGSIGNLGNEEIFC